MRISWRLLMLAAIAPAAPLAQAVQPLDASLKSPSSFDEVLGMRRPVAVEQVTLLEPTPADPAAPVPAAAAPEKSMASTIDGSSDCGCDSCGCGDLCNSCCGPTWSVRAGAAILERTKNDRRALLRGGGATIASTDDYDFDFAGGPDILITRWLQSGRGVEVRYFGALDWDASRSITTPGAWSSATTPALSGASAATFNSVYESTLNSTEINIRGAQTETIAYLAGFRWVELHEELKVSAPAIANPTTLGWNTDNHLYGGQLGSIVQLLQNGGPITAEAWFKGGIYGNAADSTFGLDRTSGGDLFGKSQRGQTAFVGDIALTSAVKLTDNLAFRSGYQLLWIEGVALAGDQVSTSNFTSGQGINTKGGVFYHGALVGLDFVW